MYLDQNIKINSMADAARKTFDSTDKRLEEIESNFHSKMRGRTMGGVIGSFFATALWIVAVVFVAINLRSYMNVDDTLFMVTIVAFGLLMVVMLIDDLMNFKFFGKVSSYGSNVSQLRSRVRVGRESISANTDTYMKTKDSGWNYQLQAGESIPDEATTIEGTLSSMDSLKNGFINSSKTGLYYVVTILITIVGSIALFPTATSLLDNFFGASSDTAQGFCWVGMIAVCIGEIFIAKLIWSCTECNVSNLTLFGIFTGPIVFIALMLAGSLIVRLVYLAIQLVLAIAAFAIAIACLCGSISGG